MSDGPKQQVKITSDGTSFGTRVYISVDDGSTWGILENVSRVAWELDAGEGHAVAHLTVHKVHAENVMAFGSDSSTACEVERGSGNTEIGSER